MEETMNHKKLLAALALGILLCALSGPNAFAFSYHDYDYDDNDDRYDYDSDSDYQTPAPTASTVPDLDATPTPTAVPTPEPAVSHFQFTLEKNAYRYTGSAITPAVAVSGAGRSGQPVTLKENEDYTIQYENNVTYGVGRVIILGKGRYSGYHILKFGILPEKVTGVKVKSPLRMENTVTWNAAKGADGYYIYRKEAGAKNYSFVANITDKNFEVFHDKSKRLKKNKNYSYKITSYVADPNQDEKTDGYRYEKPKKNNQPYIDGTSYYADYNNNYYSWYSYSAIKEKNSSAFESEEYDSGSGKVTASTSGKRYAIYTGDASLDYMAHLINSKLIKKNMSDDKRVQTIFRWMVKNCTFTKDVKDYSKLKKMKCYIKYYKSSVKKKAQAYEDKIMKQIYKGTALCIGTNWHDCSRASTALAYRKGSCSFLTPMFNILCNEAGVEAYIVDGYYVNKNKSRDYHNWSFVKLGKKYYWYDVPVACRNKSAMNVWYKKGTSFWKTCHSWQKKATKGYEGATFR